MPVVLTCRFERQESSLAGGAASPEKRNPVRKIAPPAGAESPAPTTLDKAPSVGGFGALESDATSGAKPAPSRKGSASSSSGGLNLFDPEK